MTMLRSIGSVLLGFIVILLLVGVTDAIPEKLFPAQFVNPDGSSAIPGLPLLAFIIGYVFVYAGVRGPFDRQDRAAIAPVTCAGARRAAPARQSRFRSCQLPSTAFVVSADEHCVHRLGMRGRGQLESAERESTGVIERALSKGSCSHGDRARAD